MNRKIVSVKLMKHVNSLLVLGATGVIVAIFFFEDIAEHRMQALSFFIGTGMMLEGMSIIAKQAFVCPIKILKKKSVIKKEGKAAKTIGGIIAILGVCLSIWGLLFWINFIRNI